MSLIDHSFVRNRALTHISLANAHADLGDVDGAVDAIRNSAELAKVCSSDRLGDSIFDARAGLAPWDSTPCVIDLDEELAAYGFATPRT
ncbi:hypothetical protein [Nocardia mexicana]|uniref:hypothetical protein n=1 Tax=Nocardia mexicana TaxID=279262 RepID=UPI000A05A348|nr:hypothetical protein [Nocardia mexicana]